MTASSDKRTTPAEAGYFGWLRHVDGLDPDDPVDWVITLDDVKNGASSGGVIDLIVTELTEGIACNAGDEASVESFDRGIELMSSLMEEIEAAKQELIFERRVAQLSALEGSGFVKSFRSVVSERPRRALEFIEENSSLVRHLTAVDLAPILEHEDPWVRQRAILTLSRVEQAERAEQETWPAIAPSSAANRSRGGPSA